MTLIIAGDPKQAEDYARRVDLHDGEWRYVNSSWQIRGYKDVTFIYTGQYYKNALYDNPELWNRGKVVIDNE